MTGLERLKVLQTWGRGLIEDERTASTKLPGEFDMGTWFDKDNKCGTSGCLAGWAAIYCKELRAEGLRLILRDRFTALTKFDVAYRVEGLGELTDHAALRRFFDLTPYQAKYIFSPLMYELGSHTELPEALDHLDAIVRDIENANLLDDNGLSFDQFVDGYIQAAIALSPADDRDEPYDELGFVRNDLSDQALDIIEADCKKFFTAQFEFIKDTPHQAGYDFFCDRNGHGTGARDSYEDDEETGKGLQLAAELFGRQGLVLTNLGELGIM
jgi:hypothetical protein